MALSYKTNPYIIYLYERRIFDYVNWQVRDQSHIRFIITEKIPSPENILFTVLFTSVIAKGAQF